MQKWLSKALDYFIRGFYINGENEARLRGFYRREYFPDSKTQEEKGQNQKEGES